ncbi:hypothetical protein [Sulfurospirillum multivorans]|uniref:hypothetical protein n=1 Tax=Sulfurospirillum multivorans TaxID=66821 RepID=UPI00046CB5F1|nr:hypothetical protein [Sulfurospirillum multivorans]
MTLGVVHDVDKASLPCRQVYEPSINHHYESSFNLSLEKVDFKTFKKELLRLFPNFEFKLPYPNKFNYIKEHQGFCFKNDLIYDFHTQKFMQKEESFEMWNYLFQEKDKFFELAKAQKEIA